MSRTYVDSHVHFHDGFRLATFLESAADNFGNCAEDVTTDCGALLLTQIPGGDPFERIQQQISSLKFWSMDRPDESSLVFRRDEAIPLTLIAGRQIVTLERLEVLSIGSPAEIESGRTLAETVAMIQQADGVPVIPWGFGKWWFARGRLLSHFVASLTADEASRVFVADSGCRPALLDSPIFSVAGGNGIRTLCGSDPLTVETHVGRAGSFGNVLQGKLDLRSPTAWILDRLRQLPESPPRFGQPRGILSFAADQLMVRLAR